MDKPTRVQIGPMLYEIEYVDGIREEDREYDGYHEAFSQSIHVVNGNGPTYEAATLIHEILHGIFTVGGLTEHSEEIIRLVSYGLVDLFRQNPPLIEYLQEVITPKDIPNAVESDSSSPETAGSGTLPHEQIYRDDITFSFPVRYSASNTYPSSARDGSAGSN